MTLSLTNLDATTRQFMTNEILRDVKGGTIYVSPKRLSEKGKADYINLLSEAAGAYDDQWLAYQINSQGRLNTTEPRNTKSGVTMVKVPVTASETLAEGEFNRFYARGLCLRAIGEGITHVEVYRAKAVSNPRPESIMLVGTLIGAQALLDDLRAHPGMDTALGLPPGPNSGLSVRLP